MVRREKGKSIGGEWVNGLRDQGVESATWMLKSPRRHIFKQLLYQSL